MKTRLPKVLLAALLASMAFSNAYAAAIRTGEFAVYENKTFGSDTLETMSKMAEDKKLLQSSKFEGSDNPTPIPVVKVGQGVYEIDQDITVNNPLVVREGTLKVTSDITSTSNLNNFVPYLSVGGNNATLELDNGATVSHSRQNSGNSTASMILGGADGKATIILKNKSTLHGDQYIIAGDHNGQSGVYGGAGTGHVKATYDPTTGERYADGDYDGQTIIRIESGSTLSAGTSLQFADVNVTITGEGSKLTDWQRNVEPKFQVSASNNTSWLGSDNSATKYYETTINIENGGAFESNWNLMTAAKDRGESTPKSAVNITVGSDDKDAKPSTFTVKGHFGMGDYMNDEGTIAANANTETTLTVKKGGTAFLNVVTVGAEGEASMIVEEGGAISAVDESERFYYHPDKGGDYSATGTPLITVNETGMIQNSGKIELDVELNGGVFTMENDAVAAGLTATSGVINIRGNVTFTGDVQLGTVAEATALMLTGANSPALTVYIEQGSVITLDTTSLTVDGQTFTVGEDTVFIVNLGNEVFTADTQLFTLAGANAELLASATEAIAAKTTVTWTEEGVDKSTASGDGEVKVSNIGTTVVAVPEPTTATLSLLALCGLAMRRRRK